MATLNSLKREALEACKFRGHSMGRFKHHAPKSDLRYDPDYAESTCVRCGMVVGCDASPAPNDIDIGGEAVALTCKGA